MLLGFSSCTTTASYKQRPTSISYKKYKSIQSRRYVKREVAVVPKQFRTPTKLALLFMSPTKVYYVNNNKINRNINKKAVAVRRKNQNNYQDYRESTDLARGGTDRSNFSIYDK
ncbi:MAG: hypothetical protein ACKVOU_14775 [Cytophagales bacterium]